ncbi:apolipoprotein L3-like [Onychostoma macrolepis]|uniref:Apolipoprotein L3 n=1 Tax=Onychostoma macrolepis TaxID=369639 RepID=A0A7J6CWD9_9TELE|nr:apolipoprotein L3-like [Onychostoma macrolepis]XP_058639051.1 apolipoprotein L3-like [Onychostoma macrolepis]KAF4111659.1 hypothetical protein G5714_008690 [Onychostoma macrolepis]
MSKKELEALNDELQRSIKELNSGFDEKFPTLNRKIKELNDVTDELQSMHKATTVGSLSGGVIGAAAGITALVGLFLAPLTFGASLAVAGVGTGALVTSTTCTVTNMIKQKNLRQTIKKITEDFLNIIKPLIKHIKTISDIIEEIQKKEWVSESDITLPTTVGTLETLLGISSIAIELQMAKIENVATRTARALRVAGKITSGLSFLLLPFDVFSIYQDSTEISEMNQVADKKKVEEIQSNTLKFIHQARETAALFQETLDEIESARDTINREPCVQCGGMHV